MSSPITSGDADTGAVSELANQMSAPDARALAAIKALLQARAQARARDDQGDNHPDVCRQIPN